MKIIIFCLFIGLVVSDLPTNCMYEDTVGVWTLNLGPSNQTNTIDCSKFQPVSTLQVELTFPNYAVDEYGNIGKWTMIYNQGFEINLNGRSYFAFQYYEQVSKNEFVSYCHKTFNGWVYDAVTDKKFPPKNWGCYDATKKDKITKFSKMTSIDDDETLDEPYGLKHELVQSINNIQSLWKAGVYELYANLTIRDMIKRAGGNKNLSPVLPRPSLLDGKDLPDTFDWRNKHSSNFVSPVRNQGNCGSCYAFASMAQLESSARIETNNRIKPVFSTQNIVSCSPLSQGCEGGFPFLTAGRYAHSYGVITEDKYPYIGNDTKCNPGSSDYRFFASEYGYVGGFYGGCSEVLMRLALIRYGPLSVGINVTSEFMHYKGGIFYQPETHLLGSKFNPFYLTNHAVLVVGYGVDHDSGTKYWVVKNSWGEGWGEGGFFRIRRGTNEIGIESIAVFSKIYFGH